MQRRVLYDDERSGGGRGDGGPLTRTWRLPAFFSLLYFPFSFPLSWPVALNRRFSYVARKFEVTNFVLPGPPLLDPLSCSWRVPLPCETFRSLLERISIPGSLWIHSIPDTLIDLRGSLNGGHLPAPLPTRSNVIHLYFVIHSMVTHDGRNF